MKGVNAVVVLDVKQGLDSLKNGCDALVERFMKAAREPINRTNLDLDEKVVVDFEYAIDVLSQAGIDAFAVYFLLEGLGRRTLTVSKIATLLNMTTEDAAQACYRLGLYTLGVHQ